MQKRQWGTPDPMPGGARSARPVRCRGGSTAVAWMLAIALLAGAMPAWAQGGSVSEVGNLTRAEREARTLIAKAKAAQERQPKEALALADRAAALFPDGPKQRLWREAQVIRCNNIAYDRPAAAVPVAEAVVRAARSARDSRNLAAGMTCEGYARGMLGQTSEAALLHEEAVILAERAGDPEVLADALALRGESRHYHGRYDDAIADLDRAYRINTEIGLAAGQRYTLNAIANVYSDPNVGEYDKAISYYRQLLDADQKAGDRAGMATAIFNMAGALEQKGELAAALREYERALEIDRARGDAASVAEEERAVGIVMTKQGRPAEALPWINRSLAHFLRTRDIEGQARVRLSRSTTLLAMGDNAAALADLEFARTHFEQQGNDRYMARVHELRAQAFAASGQWQRAYEASLDHRAVQSALEKRVREDQSMRLRVQFDAAKKEQENRALVIENAHRGEALRNAERVRGLQRQVIVLGAGVLLLVLALAFQQVNKGRRLRQLAMTDELTGMPNRRNILGFLDEQAKACVEEQRLLSVLTIDVDHFKKINDAHGHHGGDTVLRDVASVLEGGLPHGARVGRMGGEEFLAVLPGRGGDEAFAAAELLRHAVEGGGLQGHNPEAPVTISVGVAVLEGLDTDSLLTRADAALYRAKREGRNRSVRA